MARDCLEVCQRFQSVFQKRRGRDARDRIPSDRLASVTARSGFFVRPAGGRDSE